jgi:hypothetical protein
MRQLHLMTPEQVHELADAMVEAGIAHSLKCDWREVFRRKSHKYKLGYPHRVYSMLAKMHYSLIENLTEAIVKT